MMDFPKVIDECWLGLVDWLVTSLRSLRQKGVP